VRKARKVGKAKKVKKVKKVKEVKRESGIIGGAHVRPNPSSLF